MTSVCRWEGSIAFVQGELDNEVWEVLKDKDSHTAVHRKYMSRLSGQGKQEYLDQRCPITAAQAKAFAGMSAEVLVIEMRKLFKETRK